MRYFRRFGATAEEGIYCGEVIAHQNACFKSFLGVNPLWVSGFNLNEAIYLWQRHKGETK